MSNDVWIGALLSVPIGIATGVAVTPIQRWIENRGKNKALVESKRVREQYNSVIFYRLHPHIFTQYLLNVVIRTTFIGAAVGIIAGCIYTLAQAGDFVNIRILRSGLYVLGQITAVTSSVLIVGICKPALGLWYRVRNFDAYVRNVPADIRDMEAEAKALSGSEGAIAPVVGP